MDFGDDDDIIVKYTKNGCLQSLVSPNHGPQEDASCSGRCRVTSEKRSKFEGDECKFGFHVRSQGAPSMPMGTKPMFEVDDHISTSHNPTILSAHSESRVATALWRHSGSDPMQNCAGLLFVMVDTARSLTDSKSSSSGMNFGKLEETNSS